MKPSSGFTLIELTVVLVVMGLGIAAVGINFSSGRAGTQIRSATRDLVSALRYTRGEALVRHEQTTLTIDFTENSYRISTRAKRYKIPDAIDVTLVTTQSERRGAGTAAIRFFPDGSSTGGRVMLERERFVRRIDIHWLTGHITVGDD